MIRTILIGFVSGVILALILSGCGIEEINIPEDKIPETDVAETNKTPSHSCGDDVDVKVGVKVEIGSESNLEGEKLKPLMSEDEVLNILGDPYKIERRIWYYDGIICAATWKNCWLQFGSDGKLIDQDNINTRYLEITDW